LDPVDDSGYQIDEADVTCRDCAGSAVRRPAKPRLNRAGTLTGSTLLDRHSLGVALEADDAEILGTEDVQVSRRGPTWTP
jgi:hypothetical protein